MLDLLGRNWWLLVIRGIAAVVFGVLAFIQPVTALAALIAIFGAYAIVDGASLLISYARGDADARKAGWLVALIGAIGILAGIFTFLYPGLTALSLLYVVAFWAVFIGALQVLAAIRVRKEIEGEIWLALGGILSIAFGAILVIAPGAGLLSLVWLVGFYAVAFGVANLVLAWRLRDMHKTGNQLRRAAHA